MRQNLQLHPDCRCAAVTRITAEAVRRGGVLSLRYAVSGDMRGLRLPPPAAHSRADGLWQHTCFEAFIRPAAGDGYCEFNLSPSTQWAAYVFDTYRDGMRPLNGLAAPPIKTLTDGGRFELRSTLALDGLAELPGDAPWTLGLSAVIEEPDGNKSWWALAHPPGRPDFHHSDCFVLELPAACPP
jgi:hypothetical protein